MTSRTSESLDPQRATSLTPVGRQLKLWLYGLMGSGKSYVGRGLADKMDFVDIDGDDFLSQACKDRLKEGKGLTEELRDDWVKSCVEEVENRAKKFPNHHICIAHATMPNQMRLIPESIIRIQVWCDKEQTLARLNARPTGGREGTVKITKAQYEACEALYKAGPQPQLIVENPDPFDPVVNLVDQLMDKFPGSKFRELPTLCLSHEERKLILSLRSTEYWTKSVWDSLDDFNESRYKLHEHEKKDEARELAKHRVSTWSLAMTPPGSTPRRSEEGLPTVTE